MSLTRTQARDEVSTLINAAWLAAPASSSILMLWDDVKGDKPGEDGVTTTAASWARTTIRTISSGQTTQGRRRFQTTCIVTTQIFTAFGDGQALGDELAQILIDALRAHVGGTAGIWFFEMQAIEIGIDGPWFNVNVEAGFRYQELAQ